MSHPCNCKRSIPNLDTFIKHFGNCWLSYEGCENYLSWGIYDVLTIVPAMAFMNANNIIYKETPYKRMREEDIIIKEERAFHPNIAIMEYHIWIDELMDLVLDFFDDLADVKMLLEFKERCGCKLLSY